MPKDEQALGAAVEQAAAVLIAAGFPKMPARVLMALLVADSGGRTAAELAETLAVSPAAISGGVRYLESLGIIHRIAQPGSRRERWEVFDDAWYVALAGKSPVYAAFAAVADKAVAAIDDSESAGSRRTAEMAAFFRFFEARLPALMEEWEQLRRSGEY
ncbi:GbsR/MarR family transcriptional regulator [Agromyces seonyuensis]|uniref:MarR family transcriptional regulator n=1 Tax=Agromyces seonyuensis TaxID=2662446 RepID=A0A6I4NUD2_9MICO|nr:helix-turn-helix domain-containing protein [Agromyces seonyuensis]MWB98056.1 MarR family transcriptional regulator [Agromyces seonyuensis]